MSTYAIITQNDDSPWDDVKGDLYNYPPTYRSILSPGCKIIYYKGKMKHKSYEAERLSPDPHYFGVGVVGGSIPDSNSTKKDLYCEILDYKEFDKPVPFKANGDYLEEIPDSKKTNYWRFGVREVSQKVFEAILARTSLTSYKPQLPKPSEDLESYGNDKVEGQKKQRYTSYYERNPFYRNKALEIHGLSCMACGANFKDLYGEWGAGFIHVHHNKPVSETGPTIINPRTDMSVVCPNCHAMIHRKKNVTLSVEDVRRLLKHKG